MAKTNKESSSGLVAEARNRAGLSQRALAKRAKTAQSVVARIEGGDASPSWSTLERLLAGAGFELEVGLVPRPVLDLQELDDTPRILQLTPEQRLLELANISRFLTNARRA